MATRKSHEYNQGKEYGRAYAKARYGGGVGYLLPGRQEAARLALDHAGIQPNTDWAWDFHAGFSQEMDRVIKRTQGR